MGEVPNRWLDQEKLTEQKGEKEGGKKSKELQIKYSDKNLTITEEELATLHIRGPRGGDKALDGVETEGIKGRKVRVKMNLPVPMTARDRGHLKRHPL